MNGIPKISAGVPFLVALGVMLGVPANDLAAEPLKESSETLSIGLPPPHDGDTRRQPVLLENPRDEGLALEYNFEQFSLHGGKINPAVGISWNRPRAKEIHVVPASGFESSGKIGVSAGMRFDPDRLGSHRLRGGASFLDLSSFQNNGARGGGFEDDLPAGRRAAGAGYTGFNLMLEGGHFPIAPDLSYRIGYIQRTTGPTSSIDEAGFAASIANRFDFSTGIALTPSIEAARMSDGASVERDYFAASMLTEWQNWNLTLTYGRRDGDGSATSPIGNFEAGASIGYVFESGVTADIGWERQKQAEEIADHIGFQFKYRFGFGR